MSIRNRRALFTADPKFQNELLSVAQVASPEEYIYGQRAKVDQGLPFPIRKKIGKRPRPVGRRGRPWCLEHGNEDTTIDCELSTCMVLDMSAFTEDCSAGVGRDPRTVHQHSICCGRLCQLPFIVIVLNEERRRHRGRRKGRDNLWDYGTRNAALAESLLERLNTSRLPYSGNAFDRNHPNHSTPSIPLLVSMPERNRPAILSIFLAASSLLICPKVVADRRFTAA